MTTASHYHAHALDCPEEPIGPTLSAVRPGPALQPGAVGRSGSRGTSGSAGTEVRPVAGQQVAGRRRTSSSASSKSAGSSKSSKSAASSGSAESAGSPVIRQLPGPGAIADLLATATTQVLAMGTLSTSSPAFRYLGGHVVRPEVQFRALFPDTARTRPVLCQHLVALSVAGADVRTIEEIPLDAVVVDDRAVLLPVDGTPSSVAELTLPSAVLTARQLFERLWPEAVPLTDTDDLSTGRELNERELDTLRMLASGVTDDVIAAHMGLAVRTVRRTVSVLMNRLGARSRFQAGAKAAARGWILDPTRLDPTRLDSARLEPTSFEPTRRAAG